MRDDLDSSDVKQIIHNLITFIVVEGKEYVNDNRKREYVAGYLLVLIKIINSIEDEEEFSIVEKIANDISHYIK